MGAPCRPWDTLTDCNLEVLRLLVEGHTRKEIAARLFIALTTVDWYVRECRQKTGQKTLLGVVAEARRRGYNV